MRAAIYARFSSDAQRQASIDDQVRNCHAYAERHGWDALDDCVFADKAVSGSVSGRRDYQAMQEAAKARRFDVLIVDDLSRLSRDQEEAQRLAKRLRFWDVGLVAVSDGVDTIANPKSSALIMGVKGAMNEEQLRDLAEKTRRGLAGRAHAGLSPGGQPYGYRSEPVYGDGLDRYGKPEIVGYRRVIVPEEAEVLRRIFRLYAQGLSSRRIAQTLTAEGIPPPGARWRNRKKVAAVTWSLSAIDGNKARRVGILNNEAYLGKIIWNKFGWRHDPDADGNGRRGARRVPVLRDESEWVVTEVPELRIVSDRLWHRVKAEQARRTTKFRYRGRRTRDGNSGYMLSGLLRCGVCGANMAMRSRHGYGCTTRANRGKHLCPNSGVVNRRALEAVVLEAIRTELYGRGLIDDLTDRVRRGLIARSRRDNTDDGTRTLREALSRIEKEIGRLVDAIKAGVDTKAIREELLRLERRREALETQHTALEQRPRARLLDLLPTLPQVIRDYADNLRCLLDRGRVEQVRSGLAALVEEIEVMPGQPEGKRPCHLVRVKGALSQAFRLLPGKGQVLLVAGAGTGDAQITRPYGWEVPIGFSLRYGAVTTFVGEPVMRKAPPPKKRSRPKVAGWERVVRVLSAPRGALATNPRPTSLPPAQA